MKRTPRCLRFEFSGVEIDEAREDFLVSAQVSLRVRVHVQQRAYQSDRKELGCWISPEVCRRCTVTCIDRRNAGGARAVDQREAPLRCDVQRLTKRDWV